MPLPFIGERSAVVREVARMKRLIERSIDDAARAHQIDAGLITCVVREFAHVNTVGFLDAVPHAVALIIGARRNGSTFIVWNETHAITCFACQKTSHNPNDARFKFCPVHKYLTPPLGDDAA